MISGWQLLVILVIVILLFGTKKLRNLGSDLGGAIKSFRGAVKDGEESNSKDQIEEDDGRVIEGEVEQKEKKNV